KGIVACKRLCSRARPVGKCPNMWRQVHECGMERKNGACGRLSRSREPATDPVKVGGKTCGRSRRGACACRRQAGRSLLSAEAPRMVRVRRQARFDSPPTGLRSTAGCKDCLYHLLQPGKQT